MKQKFLLLTPLVVVAALAPSIASGTTPAVSFENLYLDMTFRRDIACQIDDTFIEIGNVTQGQTIEELVHVTGQCAKDVQLVLFPEMRESQLSGTLPSGLTYRIGLKVGSGTDYVQHDGSYTCATGSTFAHIDDQKCVIRKNTDGGPISIPLDVTVTFGDESLSAPVTFEKQIPINVWAVYND